MQNYYEVTPLPRKSDFGSVSVPGSKSISNRALCLAAFADGRSELRGILLSDDSLHCIESIKSLGVKVALDEAEKSVVIRGGLRHICSGAHCNVGSAGTVARFLTAMLAMLPGEYHIDASLQMRARPMAELIRILESGGIEFHYGAEPMHLPFSMRVAEGMPRSYRINCARSSQFLSGMLMAAAISKHDMELIVEGPLVAKPYVLMTLALLREFGIHVDQKDFIRFFIEGAQHLQAASVRIEADVSSACYFFAIPALLGGSIEVKEVHLHSIQGDIQFLRVLADMGCVVEETSHGIRVTRRGDVLKGGIDVDMNEYSDQAITLAILATAADAAVRIRNIGHIQFQESNRIEACSTELRKLGARVETTHDGILIYPSALKGGLVHTYDDHRISMAFALLGLKQPGILIENHLCCRKTYPHYFDDVASLYAS